MKSQRNLFFPVIDLTATGKNIKRLRRVKHLSVQDVQDYFGLNAPQAIYNWESGKTLPTVDNLIALSLLFRTPIEGILVLQVIPAINIHGFGLVYVFRGKACWAVCNAGHQAGHEIIPTTTK